MERDLRTILLGDNPWLTAPGALGDWLRGKLPEPYIPREAQASSSGRWGEKNRAHLVVGPRQAGKSTLIWSHLAGIGAPALFFDCEQFLVREFCRSAPLFLSELGELVDQPVTLFFDEVQHLEEAGLFVKGLVDRHVGVPILVTGSSSFHLAARTRESLAGRATRTRLLPFSLGEVTQDLAESPTAVRQEKLERRLARHVVFGGYPEVWKSDQPEFLLADLVESIILRDASDLFRIARPDAFRRLLQLAAAQVGSLVNVSEWAGVLGLSRDTVAAYLEILEHGHVLHRLPPYVGGRRAEITRRPKVYLIDNGIRGHLVGSFAPLRERPDAGAAMENWVFSELWKILPLDAGLYYWRSSSGAEVDFVISRGDTLAGIEVKAGHLGRPRLTRAVRSFIEAYRPRSFLFVSADLEHSESVGTTRVEWVTPASLASAVEALLAPGNSTDKPTSSSG